MKSFVPLMGAMMVLAAAPFIRASDRDVWEVRSPDHAQTFAFGSERSHAWMLVGRHLAVIMHFTNDPYVTDDNPRMYDDFTFDFPQVVLGADGRTFYYHPGRGTAPVPVAVRHGSLFGDEVELLPSCGLMIEEPHGFLSLSLLIDPAVAAR